MTWPEAFLSAVSMVCITVWIVAVVALLRAPRRHRPTKQSDEQEGRSDG